MRRIEALKRDVACPIGHVPFPLADMCQTLCDVGNDGWPNLDSLGVNWRQYRRMWEERNTRTFLASMSAVSQFCKRALMRARLASS